MAKALLRAPLLLEDLDYLPTRALAELLVYHFGQNISEWENESILDMLEEKYGTVGEVTKQHVMAVRALLTNDAAWTAWEVFEKCCAAINGSFPLFNFMQPPEAEDILTAFYVMGQWKMFELGPEVQKYAAAACLDDGVWYFTDELETLRDELADYDRRFGLRRDFDKVAAALAAGAKPTDNPSNFAEVQVTRILRARKELEEYKRKELGALLKVRAILAKEV